MGFAGLSNRVLGEGADRHVPGQLWDIPPCMPTFGQQSLALCWGYSLNWVVAMASKPSPAECLRGGTWRSPACVC